MSAPVLTRREITAAVECALQDSLCSAGEPEGPAFVASSRVAAVYLFGSFARGEAGPESDVDLGLLCAGAPGGRLEEQPFLLEAELSEKLGRPVQCVVMNLAPADLLHRILAGQTLLIDRDPSLRIRFEVAARNRYFDLKPLLDRYRRVGRVA